MIGPHPLQPRPLLGGFIDLAIDAVVEVYAPAAERWDTFSAWWGRQWIQAGEYAAQDSTLFTLSIHPDEFPNRFVPVPYLPRRDP